MEYATIAMVSPNVSSQLESPDQADQLQELTYVDIDTFLVTF